MEFILVTVTIDVAWAEKELNEFLELTDLYRRPDPPGVVRLGPRLSNRGGQSEIVASAQVVEQILDRVVPGWRSSVPDERNETVNRWCQHIEAAERAKVTLAREAEVREKLGDNAPQVDASRMHPWAWDGARSLWQSGHFRDAVRAASVKINAETQNKTGRRDLSETSLFNNVFSEKAPETGCPRLHVIPNDGSQTFGSVQRGARASAEGCYAAIRNPVSHDPGEELDEHVALEQLAAFSVLARWVDDAKVVT